PSVLFFHQNHPKKMPSTIPFNLSHVSVSVSNPKNNNKPTVGKIKARVFLENIIMKTTTRAITPHACCTAGSTELVTLSTRSCKVIEVPLLKLRNHWKLRLCFFQ